MADKDDTTTNRSGRTPSSLQQAIEAERTQLLQAHAVVHCLYEVLLHAEGDDSISYAEAAHVAANLIDDSVARLDSVRLRPLMHDLGGPYPGKNEVREARGVYLVNVSG
jgi:hypothetical protein